MVAFVSQKKTAAKLKANNFLSLRCSRTVNGLALKSRLNWEKVTITTNPFICDQNVSTACKESPANRYFLRIKRISVPVFQFQGVTFLRGTSAELSLRISARQNALCAAEAGKHTGPVKHELTDVRQKNWMRDEARSSSSQTIILIRSFTQMSLGESVLNKWIQ